MTCLSLRQQHKSQRPGVKRKVQKQSQWSKNRLRVDSKNTTCTRVCQKCHCELIAHLHWLYSNDSFTICTFMQLSCMPGQDDLSPQVMSQLAFVIPTQLFVCDLFIRSQFKSSFWLQSEWSNNLSFPYEGLTDCRSSWVAVCCCNYCHCFLCQTHLNQPSVLES